MKRVARLLPWFAVLAAQVAVASETPPSLLLQWGSPGPGNGEFAYPRGVATDVAGNVYIADQNNDRIQKFTSNGVYVSQWGTFGTGNGEFKVPPRISRLGPTDTSTSWRPETAACRSSPTPEASCARGARRARVPMSSTSPGRSASTTREMSTSRAVSPAPLLASRNSRATARS